VPRRELVIAAGPGEWRAALFEAGGAVELYVERGEGAEIGSIHLGRVTRRLPALAAVLVDIGGDRPVFLPDRDILPRSRGLDEGEPVIVQIRREAQAGKSARGTMRPVLRGRFVALELGSPGLKGGEALAPADAARLMAAIGRAGTGSAAGLRLLGTDAPPFDALLAEAALLARRWEQIRDRAAQRDPPARLDPRATFAAALAGAMPVMPDAVVVDDPAAVPELRMAFAGAAVEHRPEALLSLDLDALFEDALSPTIALAGGGAVHIEAARAAVLIDVDSGSPERGSPEQIGLAADLAAARVIARQIRLRNLGGGIIVDFVGLDRPRLRERVRAALADALAPDPVPTQLLGWTRLGHLELVRPRHRRPLAEALGERRTEGVLVKSAMTVALEALRAVRRAARVEPGRSWGLAVAPEVAASLSGPAAGARGALETQLARGLAVIPEPGRPRERFEIIRR
jgi:Rne/Rng family ribonuclease